MEREGGETISRKIFSKLFFDSRQILIKGRQRILLTYKNSGEDPDRSSFNEKEYYPVYPAILASHNVEVCNNKAKRTLQVLLSRRRRCIRRLRVLVEIFEERGRESWFVERCSKGE